MMRPNHGKKCIHLTVLSRETKSTKNKLWHHWRRVPVLFFSSLGQLTCLRIKGLELNWATEMTLTYETSSKLDDDLPRYFLSGRSLTENRRHIQFSIIFGEFNRLTVNKRVPRWKKKKKKIQGYCSSLVNETAVTTSNLKGGERELLLKGESMERLL